MEFKFTEFADQDLQAISYYIALDNEKAAEQVFESILDTCAMIAEMPDIGRRPMYVEDKEVLYVSVKKYKRHLVFYQKRSLDVLILRVIHSARDLPSLFND